MSISNTTNKVIYQGDGSTKQFPFSFRIFDETDLVVSLYEIATGIETELTLNSDYTVTINGNNGGTVIMVTAPSSSYKLIIKRILPLTQETDYVEGDPFPAESHERALDKLTMITQQLNEQLDRTVKVDITQTNIETTLPIPDALKFLRWNSDASKLENASGITSTEYPSTISLGLDANKPTNPAQGDIYIATDSQKVYVCHSTGTWTEYKVNILSGTDANKPTTYKQDRFYWATDTKKLYWDNGSSWTDISAQLNVDKVDGADLDTDGTLSANSDSKIPSQKAVKTYVDEKTSIKDTDADTSLDVEETSDADTIVGKVAGVECLRFHNNGIMDLAKQSGFSAKRSTLQSIPNDTYTKVQYNIEEYDIQNEYDNSTNFRWTATKSGRYAISASLLSGESSWPAGKYWQIVVYKNGVNVKKGIRAVADASITTYLHSIVSCDLEVAENDYIEIYVNHNRGDTTNIHTDATFNYFSIHKIS